MRLIDADEIVIELTKQKAHFMSKASQTSIKADRLMYKNTAIGIQHALNVIDNAPTIIWCSETSEGLPLMDLRPRPQGKWIMKTDDVGFISHICSECGAEIEVENPCDNKYCWNCGAQMKTRTDAD